MENQDDMVHQVLKDHKVTPEGLGCKEREVSWACPEFLDPEVSKA